MFKNVRTWFSLVSLQGMQEFSVKGQVVNILALVATQCLSQNTELFFFGAECVSVHYVNNPHDCVPIKLYKNKQRATFGLGL